MAFCQNTSYATRLFAYRLKKKRVDKFSEQ